MTHDQVIDLLSMITAYDRRTVGEADVHAWHAALDDVSWPDARQAVVEHYRESREWLMPADIRRRVHHTRTARMANAHVPQPPSTVDPDDTTAYREWLRTTRASLASGSEPPLDDRATLAPRSLPPVGQVTHTVSPPTEEYRRERERIRRARTADEEPDQ